MNRMSGRPAWKRDKVGESVLRLYPAINYICNREGIHYAIRAV